jgi:CheY-like chemotaxis protein
MTPDHSCIPAVVLIVEDEMVLRMRAVDMVEDAGYTPLEALDAAEAVAILEFPIRRRVDMHRYPYAWPNGRASDLRMPCMSVGRLLGSS